MVLTNKPTFLFFITDFFILLLNRESNVKVPGELLLEYKLCSSLFFDRVRIHHNMLPYIDFSQYEIA